MKSKNLKIIGWREIVSLPDLGIAKIKAKVDTGARTSSLHAFNIVKYTKSGKEYIRFDLHPELKNSISCHAKVLEYRKVKSSNGQSELRPVILTSIELLNEAWIIEITLTNRDTMGFPMLLGRASFRGRFLVNAGNSYYSKRATKKIKSE